MMKYLPSSAIMYLNNRNGDTAYNEIRWIGAERMNRTQAVLFDLDNTLLDRTQTFRKFAESFAETYFSHLAHTEAVIAQIVERDQDGYKDKAKLFEELLEVLPWDVKPTHAELMLFYESRYVTCAVLMEYAEEIIDYVRAKYRIGLITNGRTVIQYGKIDRLGLRDLFDVIVVSEEAGVKKPNPEIFNKAVESLGLRADQCLYVGDHPVNDIQGAGKAGMGAVWIEVNQPWNEQLTIHPAHKIKSLKELIQIL
jgi:haloacid dehalogenase superfamily, subfamily IA, variant 3 with third motif having DD or ED/haloacid dehalogenase superfamily, subfamily IA, variant 1 with third motif having Dx(3-4)D or Dx(3-4)E